MNYEAQKIKTVAEAFLDAANVCNKYPNKLEERNPFSAFPITVLGVFAIELYLKAIICQETGANQTKGHLLGELFKQLSSSSQGAIICYKGNPDPNFDDNLDSISNAFVDWRYIYEAKGKNVAFNGNFFNTFSDAIVELANKIIQ